MKHAYFDCKCNEQECPYCDGGLGLCTTCGGFDGSLTTDCCGHTVSDKLLQAVYAEGLDYKEGRWVVYAKKCATCMHRNFIRGGVYSLCSPPIPGKKYCRRYYLDNKVTPSSGG